jgi:hypothetical protein
MKKNELIAIRPFVEADLPFIFATWIQGYQGGHQWFRKVPRKLFWEQYKPVVEALLKSRDVKVACLKEDPDTIVAYCVYKGERVDWIHVKENWRKIGIAKDLLPVNFSSVSHLTNVAFEILKKHPKITFNPFL